MLELNLSYNSVGPAGAAALAAVLLAPECALRRLELNFNPLENAGVDALAETLRTAPKTPNKAPQLTAHYAGGASHEAQARLRAAARQRELGLDA